MRETKSPHEFLRTYPQNLITRYDWHVMAPHFFSLLDKNPLQLTSHLHISRFPSHLEKCQNLSQSPSQKTVHLGEKAMSMVLSRMPVLTSLKVKKNVKIMIAKSIFRIIMIMIPILWMRIRVILQLLTSWRFSHKMMNSEY